ncbi:hypothetical protein K438DRAFT_1947604 [Mycena galopus ATCC 62051]|nr:hypothetical protein K438DRAFT_1947604 [Mycena galopus ATCC 62051]
MSIATRGWWWYEGKRGGVTVSQSCRRYGAGDVTRSPLHLIDKMLLDPGTVSSVGACCPRPSELVRRVLKVVRICVHLETVWDTLRVAPPRLGSCWKPSQGPKFVEEHLWIWFLEERVKGSMSLSMHDGRQMDAPGKLLSTDKVFVNIHAATCDKRVSGNSPGVPYVLEICPAGHHSPNGDSFAVIKVLHGAIECTYFESLRRKERNRSSSAPKRLINRAAHLPIERSINYEAPQAMSAARSSATSLVTRMTSTTATFGVHYVDQQAEMHQFTPNSDMGFADFRRREREARSQQA